MIMNAVFTSKLDCPFISYNYYYISTKKCNGELIAVTFLIVLKKKVNYLNTKKLPSNVSLGLIINKMHTTKKIEKMLTQIMHGAEMP